MKNNIVIFSILNFILYIFYGLIIGISLIPSALLIRYVYVASGDGVGQVLFTVLAAGVGIYLFFIFGLFVMGAVERVLSIGLTPGRYAQASPRFLQWIIYSGVHTMCLSLILPYVLGSSFINLYYKIIGCKMGGNVFVNTVGLHDAYLLEIGNNVVIGGKADISCHTFEDGFLVLDRIVIGNDVLIGANSYIMPGVSIGSRSDIGANALVKKGRRIESGSLIMPVPAMPARQTAKLMNLAKSSGKKPKEPVQ